jgi:hypothetical protein
MLRPDADEETCEAWAHLILRHNDAHVHKYRLTPRPADPQQRYVLQQAIREYGDGYHCIFEDERSAKPLRSLVPENFKAAKAAVSANLELCQHKLRIDDYASTVVYLECVLSALHDLLDAVTQEISHGGQG